MRSIKTEELKSVSGGIETVIVKGRKMTEEEKREFDETPEGKQNAEDVKNGTNKT